MIALNSAPVASAHQRTGHQGQPMTVGGHHDHRGALDDELRAVEVVARVFTGDRKLRAGDEVAQALAGQRHRSAAGRFRQRRKVLARQRLHLRLEAIGSHLHVRAVLLDPHVGVGQRLDDLEQFLGRQRQRSTARDGRVAGASQTDLEIGRQQTHLAHRPLRAARWPEWEWCSCVRRCPGNTAVRAAGRSSGQPVPCSAVLALVVAGLVFYRS